MHVTVKVSSECDWAMSIVQTQPPDIMLLKKMLMAQHRNCQSGYLRQLSRYITHGLNQQPKYCCNH